ncbi:hypothetical protein D3C81_1673560 [compost metagenome]
MSTTPASRVKVIGLLASPISPKWSTRTEAKICPATTSNRNPLAPSWGVMAVALPTYTAPKMPPIHSHQDPCKALPTSGADTRRTNSAITTTTALTNSEVNAPQSGCPNARPTAALLAAWKGRTAPASKAVPTGISARATALLNMAFPFGDDWFR